jgi:hypothetical protein
MRYLAALLIWLLAAGAGAAARGLLEHDARAQAQPNHRMEILPPRTVPAIHAAPHADELPPLRTERPKQPRPRLTPEAPPAAPAPAPESTPAPTPAPPARAPAPPAAPAPAPPPSPPDDGHGSEGVG